MKFSNEECRKTYSVAISLVLLVTAVSVFSLGLSGEPAVEETRSGPVRGGETRYLEGSMWIPETYEEERMWVTVYLENQDRTRVKALNSDDHYNGREVANSFSFPLDGGNHESGEVRRPLVELFTATNCIYCPGPEGAMDRLIQKGFFPNNFSLIEWHIRNDPYTNNAAEGRATSYGVESTPATIYEGSLVFLGGDASNENKQIDRMIEDIVDLTSSYRPSASFGGSGNVVPNGTGGFDLSFNVSMSLVNALPRGNWTFTAAVCEDINKITTDYHNLRMIGRRVFSTGRLYDLQEDHPLISINEAVTLPDDPVMGDVAITWNANDPQDDEDVTINILLKELFGAYEYIAEDEVNDGEFIWNTTSPRVPDGEYQIIIEAIDSDGNAISETTRYFTLDNMDFPEGDFVYPRSGDSISGRAVVRWNSSDDEDEMGALWVRISISNDTGQNWRVLTYNPAKDDFIVNDGNFDFNTANYKDLATYQLMMELRDTDDMYTILFSDIFEIYNNDEPTIWILSPEINEEVTGTLDIGWKVEDQEDLPSSITGNFSIRKESQEDWKVLFLGPLDDTMENKTFATSELKGDGGYTLRFRATDSRGKSVYIDRVFTVYDPDPPVFGAVNGPPAVVKDTLKVSWECTDADAGEIITYSIYLREEQIDEWSLMESGITGNNYTIGTEGLNQTNWFMKIVAVDSCCYHLSDEVVLGPFYVEIDERPVITPVNPGAGFNGSLGSKNISETASFHPITISWSGFDPDGDGISYSVYYRLTSSEEWITIASDITDESIIWNFTLVPEGEYMLRITGRDNSSKRLESEVLIGPFVILVPEEDGDDQPPDDLPPDDETDDWIDLDIIRYVVIGISVLIGLILLIVIILVVVSLGKKKKALPDENVDLTVPHFERSQPQRPIMVPQQYTPAVQGGELPGSGTPDAAAQAEPGQEAPVLGDVAWEDESEDGEEDADGSNPGEEGMTETTDAGAEPPAGQEPQPLPDPPVLPDQL
ncbi:MAG: hypothetical protein ACMUIG_10745 [Thermoplasmatota archaeon]